MEIKQLNSLVLDNRYEIQQQLSHKAGRQTLLAKDIESQELVIIKLLQFDSLFKWDDLKLFEREAKTLKNLDHPAIPKYLDYFEIDNEQIHGFPKGYRCAYALVQTYIDAPSLEDTIQQGRKFTETELIELAQKLLKILDYLHSCNPPIIHRDIKPSNILLSNRTGNSIGELYLVDFGSVQTAASRGEGTITIVGSYGYIPLEQFGGQTTTASDLYSLGMTLIYIITGVHPAELPQDNGRVKFEDSQIGNELQRWLVKMTEPYLDKRFNSAKSAQAGLLAKEQSSGSFINLKPSDSKIQLNRDRHKLEIIFQPKLISRDSYSNISQGSAKDCRRTKRNFRRIKKSFKLLCQIVIEVLISIIILQCPWQIWLIYLTVRIPYFIYFQYSFGYKKISRTKRYFLEKHKTYYQIISIDKNRTVKVASYYDQRPEKLKWRSIFAENEVDLVVYNPGYSFEEMRIPHQLSLHAHTKEFFVGNHSPQLDSFLDWNLWNSRAELLWLGREISDFFGLELQIIYSTPKKIENSKYTRIQQVQKHQASDSYISLSDYFY